MFFFVALQFVVVTAIILLVLCQNSEDNVSDFAPSRTGSASVVGGISPVAKLTWVCAVVFFLNTIALGIIISPASRTPKVFASQKDLVTQDSNLSSSDDLIQKEK